MLTPAVDTGLIKVFKMTKHNRNTMIATDWGLDNR